jgi:TPR repeat protein
MSQEFNVYSFILISLVILAIIFSVMVARKIVPAAWPSGHKKNITIALAALFILGVVNKWVAFPTAKILYEQTANKKITLREFQKNNCPTPEQEPNLEPSDKKFSAQFSIAYEAFSNRDFQKAASSFMEIAKDGDGAAQYMVGLMHLLGLGVEKDPAIAALMFEEAAANNNHKAQEILGYALVRGEHGFKQDYKRAFHKFSAAAKQGNITAQTYIGTMLVEGKGVEKDLVRGMEFLSASAKKGDKKAQYYLGSLMVQGIIEGADPEEGETWIYCSALQGYDQAFSMLGQVADNSGVENGKIYAYMFYGLAVQGGDLRPQPRLEKLERELSEPQKRSAKKQAAEWLAIVKPLWAKKLPTMMFSTATTVPFLR